MLYSPPIDISNLQTKKTKQVFIKTWSEIPGEIWKVITESENAEIKFYVSDQGRVKRVSETINGKTLTVLLEGHQRTISSKMIVHIPLSPRRQGYAINELVMKLHRPFEDMARYKVVPADCDHKNCKLDNLLWVGTGEYQRWKKGCFPRKAKLKTKVVKSRSSGKTSERLVRHSTKEILQMRKLHSDNLSMSEIARLFTCSVSYVHYVIHEKQRKFG